MSASYDGPERRLKDSESVSLKQYVETRFNLLAQSVGDQLKSQEYSILSLVEATRVAGVTLKEAVTASQLAADLRYQQRFEAQSAALDTAFHSQEEAMRTAFTVAEKAVQAALAAADRAVTKAELAADKRFETVTDLMAEKFESMNRLVNGQQERLDLSTGHELGGRQKRDDTKSLIAIAVAVLAALLTLYKAIVPVPIAPPQVIYAQPPGADR